MAMIATNSFAKDSALKIAITAQDFDRVKAALDAGCDPNESLGTSTILSWAAAWGCQVNMVKLLLEKGAKVDGVGSLGLTPLTSVVWGNAMPADIIAKNNKTNATILKHFTEEKAKEKGWWAQTDTSKFSTPSEIAKVLLDAGANPNYLLGNGLVKIGTPFLDAVKEEKLELVKVMLDSKKVDTELRFDQWAESVDRFVNTIHAGVYDNKEVARDWAKIPQFNSPLIFAVEKHNLELVKLLIEAGADMNNGKKVSGYKGHTFGYLSPLDIAVDKGFTDIIEYLKSKGALRNQE